MIIPSKKKAVSVIISKMRPDGSMNEGGEVKNEVEADVKDSALHSHAEDMISAIHNKSPSDLMHAMRNFLSEHELHEEKSEEDPSDYSPED